MRVLPRSALAAVACLVLPTGAWLGGCSGGGHSSQSEEEGGTPNVDAGAGDTSVAADATVVDAADGAAVGRDASDAEDAAPDVTIADSAPPPLDFGIDAAACNLGARGEPTDLACTGLYSDWDAKTVTPGLVQYAPGLVFWSDGAAKTRWLYLPPGTQIDTSDMDEWAFPVGTKIWKEFRLPIGDGGAETRIETRLLWKLPPNQWYRTTYVWSADGTSTATELTTGELDAGGTGYEIPNQIRCNQCHNGRRDGVLGLEAVSLAAPAATGITMGTLADAGLITDLPDASLTVPGDPVAAAALGWLHSNCGTACHNDGQGQAQSTGLWMRLDVATLASVDATDTYTTAWNQETAAFPIPDASVSYRIHACDTSSSAVYYRASHRDGVDGTPLGTQMPPIDTHKVDTVDLASLAAWIDEGCDAGDGG